MSPTRPHWTAPIGHTDRPPVRGPAGRHAQPTTTKTRAHPPIDRGSQRPTWLWWITADPACVVSDSEYGFGVLTAPAGQSKHRPRMASPSGGGSAKPPDSMRQPGLPQATVWAGAAR